MAGGIASELAAAGFDDAVEVGRGGGGVVYRCHQKSLGRSVAIKVLASDLDEDDRERFLREGYAMGALSGHPNIVNILQVGVTESHRPFIVMPYHAAGSLADRVRREGRIAWPEALRIGVKLCGALETAHRTGTLHRDIKPANVLVNDYGEPQLSDFGTARIAGGYKTVTGFFTGTLSYTAPEVLAGNPPTVAADVYSLGATIYALIAGSAAARAQGRRGSDRALSADHVDARAGPAARRESPPMCALRSRRRCRIEPADRQASAAEFGRELQLAQRHNGLTADPMALSEPGGQPEQTGGTQAIPLSERPASRIHPERVPIPPGGSTRGARPRRTRTCSRTPRRSASRACRGKPVDAPQPPQPRGRTDRPEPRRRSGIASRLLIASAAAAAVLLLVISGVFIVTSSRDNGGGEAHAATESTDRRSAAGVAADRGCARRPRRGGGHRGRRHHLGLRRHGGRQPRQRATRGLRPRASTAGRAARTYPFPCSTRWR